MKNRSKGSRQKRSCAMCNKRKNLAFDPLEKICADCLVDYRDEVITNHKNGKISFENALNEIMSRCRMSEKDALNRLFPPLGLDDFQDERLAMKLHFDPKVVKMLEERDKKEKLI